LAQELSYNYFQLKNKKISVDDINHAVECGMFVYAQDGIPVILDIEYNMADKIGLKTSKAVLIQRLDTNEPIVKVVSNSFQGNIDKNLVDFFEGRNGEVMNFAYETAAEQALQPRRSGTETKCGFLLNQPREGY